MRRLVYFYSATSRRYRGAMWSIFTPALTTAGFPVTTGAYQQTNKAAANAGRNAFVTKLSPDASTLLYSTYLGGSGFNNGVFRDGDYAAGIALDAAGDAFVAGTTVSTDFPHTSGVVQPQNNAQKINGTNLFVSKLSSDGSTLVYSTYLGGTGISTCRRSPEIS
jgi:hypothetical protein